MTMDKVDVCTDCMFYITNNHTDDETNTLELICTKSKPFLEAYCAYIQTGQPFFSWSSCDVCERYLSGMRYKIILIPN